MDILHSLYDIVSGLGSFLLIPVFFFLLGLASRAGVQRSGQCALAVLGSTVAIQLLISTLSGQLVTLVNTMIDTYSLSTGAANLHWQKAAEVTLNSDVLYWVLPGAVLLNLLMLACRVTRVLNMDLWSLWQAAFAGVLVQQLTGEMWYGLTAALLMVVLQIILADVFTAPVSRLTGTSHITFTQSFAVGTAPLAWLCNFLINLIPGLRDRRVSLEQSRRGNFLLEPSLWGLILGFIMGMAAGLPLYDAVSFALVAAGCLFALPRLLRVFGRAAASVLEPLTARKTCHGRLPLNVAVNAVVGTANATTLLSAIILVPVTVALVESPAGFLVQQRPAKGLLAGLWQPLLWESEHLLQAEVLARLAALGVDTGTAVPEALPAAKHIFSHIEWLLSGVALTVPEQAAPAGCVWASREELRTTYTLPGAFAAYKDRMLE